MNGTVAPPSSSSTATFTWAGRTFSSAAICNRILSKALGDRLRRRRAVCHSEGGEIAALSVRIADRGGRAPRRETTRKTCRQQRPARRRFPFHHLAGAEHARQCAQHQAVGHHPEGPPTGAAGGPGNRPPPG